MITTGFRNLKYKIKKKCTLCRDNKLVQILKFGKTPLANSYPKTKNEKEFFFPLTVLLCKSCGHSQLRELVNPSIMFKNYLYVSGTSNVLRKHFEDYALKMIKKFNLKKSDFIIDIACNDGTFLKNFTDKKFKNVIGVDPASNLRKYNLKKKIKINTFFFNYKKSLLLKKKYKPFKLITANNVCAHIPDVFDFFKGIKKILKEDGVFVFEVSYLLDVINKLSFDTIYHEHMSYHALKPLISFAKSNNLEVFDFDLIKAQGGSIRVYICHKNQFKIEKQKIKKQISIEKNKGLFNIELFKNYMKRINREKNRLSKILRDMRKRNVEVVGFGAPAKLTTFSYKFKIDNELISNIVDDNDLKQNRLSPGKNIKIISYEKLKKINFGAVIIFAWNFAESIIMRIKKDYKNKKIIIPFPKVKVIKS